MRIDSSMTSLPSRMIRSAGGGDTFEDRLKQRMDVSKEANLQEELRQKVATEARRGDEPDLHMKLIKEKAEKGVAADASAPVTSKSQEVPGYDASGDLQSSSGQRSGQLINLEA